MEIVENLIVLVFEVMYYSLFIKGCRKESKLWKYVALFCLITIVGLFISTNNLFSYLLLIIMIVAGLKYFVKIKMSYFDVFMVILMLVIKTIIELIICPLTYLVLNNTFIPLMIANIIKIIVVSRRMALNNCYRYLKKMWDNNNFYLRYILMCSLYIYVICSVLFLIYR